MKDVVKLLKDYQDVFVVVDGKVDYTDMVKHKIDTGDVVPSKLLLRHMGPAQRETLDKELD